jgi:FkbM family methyltransferase
MPVKKINYKYGERIISRLGRAKYNINGLKMYLSPLNMIDKQLIRGKSQDNTIENLIYTVNWNNSIFVDIGANWGLYSLIAAKQGAGVIAFEPVTRELELMNRHIELNHFSNLITVYPIGLSDDLSEKEIFLGPDRNTGTNTLLDQADSLSEVCILNRLDNVLPASIAERIRLVKIDVEGYEMNVLKGMSKLMPFMSESKFVVEITPDFLRKAQSGPEEIYGFFSEYGFNSTYGLRDESQYDEIFVKAD